MNVIIKNILNTIIDNGYDAYLVGGFVRDMIWNIESHDIDICTNAPIDVLIDIFSSYNPKIFKYDSLKFKVDSFKIDIARLRSETYNNNETKVSFTNDLSDDYLRRDFTFNALYLNSNNEIVSFGSSLDDCLNKRIRFIGDSSKKIEEDGSRLLRYIYFIIKYDLNYTNIKFNRDIFSSYLLDSDNMVLIDSLMNRIVKLNKELRLQTVLKDLGIEDLYNHYKS